jgi:uncharacterized protein (TIGR02594 family)
MASEKANRPLAVRATGSHPTRRTLLAGLACSCSIGVAGAFAAPAPFRPDLETGPLPHPIVGGTGRPTGGEAETAARILARAPASSPLQVMLYFERLRAKNVDGEAYNAGWQNSRWNPIIVTFFEATATKPEGDTTSWCAASLNWALKQCGYRGGTGSASSGSFRDGPGATKHPSPGDIVVFRNTDLVTARAGRGHVGLYLAQTRTQVLVLGGNQTDPRGHSAMKRKWLDKANDHLVLHSYHHVRAFA